MVKTQTDEKGNFIFNDRTYFGNGTIELHEWNNLKIINNRGYGFHLNLKDSQYGYACDVKNNIINDFDIDGYYGFLGMAYSNFSQGGIINNVIDTFILGNYVSIGDIRSNTSTAIYSNLIEGRIYYNDIDQIYNNNAGPITYNTGRHSSIFDNWASEISYNNLRHYDPSGIHNNWATAQNLLYDIIGNDCMGIISNENEGDISKNLGNFTITSNGNLGNIEGNSLLSGTISNNYNEGVIKHNRTIGNISGNSSSVGDIEANDAYSIENA